MQVQVELVPAALTPSGTGKESYAIRANPRKEGWWMATFYDEGGGAIRVHFDTLTLRNLGAALVVAGEP